MKKTYNSTSENVLQMLKFILKKDKFTISNIINYFSDYGVIFEQETILKYIRTLKKAGFVFEKSGRKNYTLTSIPISLNETDVNALENIFEVMGNNFSMKNAKITEKLLKISPESLRLALHHASYNKQVSALQELEKYLKDNLRLEVSVGKTNKNRKTIIFELQDLFLQGNGIFLKGYSVTGKMPLVLPFENITKIIQTPVKNRFLFGDKEAVVKFSFKMSKSYNLKAGEQILKKTKDFLEIKTNYYDEETFFKKILRYVDSCEILQPYYLRENFIGYIKNLYQMYDCNI